MRPTEKSEINPALGLPVAKFQPKRDFEIINRFYFKQFHKETRHDELLKEFRFGQIFYFTHPLQRRAESLGNGCSQHWWEPSGGYNADLFAGIVTGVRTLSTGISSPETGYNAKATFPALLLTVAPHRDPFRVLPWHMFYHTHHYRDYRAELGR
jgi:hypothetical protein